MLEGKNLQPGLIYPIRLPFRIERELKHFSDKQKLKEFINTKPNLKINVKGSFLSGKEKVTTRSKNL